MARTKKQPTIEDRVESGYIDLTKTGPLSYRELRRLNNGLPEESVVNAQRPDNIGAIATFQRAGKVNYTQQPTGLGDSMYDPGVANQEQIENLQDYRAEAQPWYAKIGAGVAKMGILALTTFTDGILGSIAGLANLVGDAATGKIGSVEDALWSFINNPFSQAMQQINEDAESWLPNYYTEYEQSQPWYTQIGTANFIGDKFLKNLGFTIGAAGSAFISAGLGSKVLVNKSIRDAFKGVVVNSVGKELKTGAQIYKAYRAGDAIMDGVKLTEDLGKAAKQMKNAEAKLKFLGSITSAAGEGRIEAITNANQWEENFVGHLDEKHNNYAKELEDQMYEEHPEDFGFDEEGNRIIVNPTAIQEYNDKIREEQQNYENARAQISSQKASIGNSIFGLNLALLAGSNLWQFGRFMSGGYTAGRTARNLVKGSMRGGYTANKVIARAKRIRAWSNPLMEAQEEMSQAGISEGAGLWGSSNLNSQFGSFYGGKIDPDAEADAQSWLGSIVQGFANSYGSIDRWEEGFIGGLTGLLGIPKIKMKTKENGKKGISFSLDGELWQGLRDAKSLNREANEVAEALNKRVQDPEFLNYYQGMIRHNSYQATMDGALDVGDEFEFKNAEHSQMVSDAIMFDKAGRLQDLYDMIEEGANTSLQDVKTLRELSVDKQTGKSLYDNMTDEQVVEHVKKQAADMKKTVDKYTEISTNLKTLYGDGISSDVLEELTWGMTQVDNWEERLGQLSKDLRDTLSNKAQAIKDRFGIDIDVTLNNLADFGTNFSADKNLINEINDIIDDQNLTVQEGRDKIEAAIKTRQQKERANNLALGRNILKMRRKFKASRDRLEKQREKALTQIDKLQKEQGRIEGLRAEELQDYQDYVEQARATLEEDLDIIRELRKSHPSDSEVYGESEELIKQELDRLERLESGADIYESFAPVLDKVSQAISLAEERFNSEVVIDKRFKKGYDPNSKPVAIGSESSEGTQMVSEAEAEERHRVKEENYNLLFQIMDLKDALNDPNNQLMSPLDIQKLNEKLIDMAKLISVRTKFIDTYQQLSKNPELFQEKIQEKMRSAIAAHIEKQVNAGVEAVSLASTLGELREALSSLENPEYIPQILEKLKESDNEDLKSIVEEYEGIEDMREVIFGTGEEDLGIVGSLTGTEEEMKKVVEAINIIQDALDTSDSLQEAKKTLGKAITDNQSEDKELADALEKILDRYDELSSSKNSRKKDKKAKKKVKKRVHLDDLNDDESTENSDDESSTDKSDSKKKKKKSIFESLDEEDDPVFDDNEDDEDVDEGEEGEDDELDTPDDPKSDDIDIVKSLKEASEDELDEVITGTSELLKDLSDKDKKSIKKLAEKIKKQKKAPSVHTDSRGTNSEFRVEPEKKGNSVHRSWIVTGYEIDPLKDRKSRKAVQFDHPTANALRALGAFEFVDSGKLGVLLNENPDLAIHYITAPSKDGLENTVLLAIEVTPEVKEVGIINAIKGSDGKLYQVVGSLGFDRKDKRATKNYEDIVKGLEEERGSTGNNSSSDYIVSQKYSNKISHIYSGRMVKSTEHKPEVQRINLKDLLNGERPHFGIYYNSTDFRTPTLSDQEVVKPNDNNANPREGSIWLMTREADGRYYAKAIQVKRFTNDEWNFEEHKDTPIMQRIRDDLKTLADSNASDYDRAIAKFDLETMLYFPGDAQFYFTGDIVSLKDSEGKNIANNIGEGKSAEEKVEDMLSALEGLNLRFQVSTHELGASESYVEDLMDSDILSTDLAMVHNVNASFDMPLLDPKTGKPLQNVKAEETKGHTGKRGIQSSLASTTIMIGRERYSLYEDGSVKLGDETVTDQDIIDEVIFRDKVAQGIVQPVEGNANLYLGTYSSGEEFGLLNGKLKTGDELEELKDKAAKRVKKQKQEETRKKVAEKLDDQDSSDDELFDDAKEGFFEDKEDNTDTDEDDDLFDSATEGLFDNEDDSEVNEEEDEDDDEDDFLFDDAEEGFFEEDEEEVEEDEEYDEDEEDNPKLSPKPKAQPKVDISLGETFNPTGSSSAVSATFNKLMIANRALWKEICPTFVALKQKAAELGIDVNSITTQEQFEGMLTQIRCKK